MDLLLSFGSLTAHLKFELPSGLLRPVLGRYASFRLPLSACRAPDLRLNITFRPASPDDPGGRAPVVRRSGRTIRGDDSDFSLEIRRKGERWSGEANAVASDYTVDTMLRVLWSVLLPPQQGLLLHACAIHEGGRGWLFPGVSGTGKSTLAGKVGNPEAVLSDELVVVRRFGPGSWKVFSTPFRGDFQIGGGDFRGWPMTHLLFLKKGPRFALTPVHAGETAHRLLSTLVCFEDGASPVRDNLHLAGLLAGDLECRETTMSLRMPLKRLTDALQEESGADPLEHDRTPREEISQIRRSLLHHGGYAIRPGGSSMRPTLKTGDLLFLEPVSEEEVVPGDVLACWCPDARPEGDRLICHRLVRKGRRGNRTILYTKGDGLASLERNVLGRDTELLGRVLSRTRKGKTRPVRGTLRNVAGLFRSLASVPWRKMRGQ